jgi:hypothetical protein
VGGLIGMLAMSTKQDAEKISQRRSRFDQRLNVPKRTPRLFTHCGLADGLFEHPARHSFLATIRNSSSCRGSKSAFGAYLGMTEAS